MIHTGVNPMQTPAAEEDEMPKDNPWDGLWWIEGNYGGLCVLKPVMRQIFGDYAYRGGTMEGRVIGRTFIGDWLERGPNGSGKFRLVISHDGNTVIGLWWYGDRRTPPKNAETWVMTKKRPDEFRLKWGT